MKTKIWKKVCERIRIIEENGKYVVEHREKSPPFKRDVDGKRMKFTGWQTINVFGTHKHALNKKHSYIVMILMRDLGYRNEFVQRRNNRKNK